MEFIVTHTGLIFPEMSVLDNLCMTADHRLPEIWRRNSQRRMIRQEYIRLTEHDPFTRNVNELSREERTELVFMRIYMQRPEVLIIEQPFKGADAVLFVESVHAVLPVQAMASLMSRRSSSYVSQAGRSGLAAMIASVLRKRMPALLARIMPRSLKLSPTAMVS